MEVTMNFITELKYKFGLHHWPPKADGEYFKDGSCEVRLT
jgi:hypothetical protein